MSPALNKVYKFGPCEVWVDWGDEFNIGESVFQALFIYIYGHLHVVVGVGEVVAVGEAVFEKNCADCACLGFREGFAYRRGGFAQAVGARFSFGFGRRVFHCCREGLGAR